MQPLYLEGSRPTQIALEEGPALAITSAGESMRLLPLDLLSHIVSRGGNINWSQAALLALAERDIPIFLNDNDHHLTAAFRSARQAPAQDWNRFLRLVEDPDGIPYYKQFLKAKKIQMQQDVSERWQPLPDIRLPGYYRAARIVRSAIQADLEAELHHRGFRRRLPLLRQAGIDMGGDFLAIIEPWVHWIINEGWKHRVIRGIDHIEDGMPSRRTLIHQYEQRADIVRDSIRSLVVAFLYWLAEADANLLTTGTHHP